MVYSVLLNKVLVREIQSDREIYIEGDNIIRGEVIDFGEGTENEKMQIALHDTVLFDKRNSIPVPFETDLYVIKQEGIIVVEK